VLLPLKGITSQKAQIFNTKNTDTHEFTPAQSMHCKIHGPRIRQRRLLCGGSQRPNGQECRRILLAKACENFRLLVAHSAGPNRKNLSIIIFQLSMVNSMKKDH
jgi:hypothetical protein